MKTSLCLALTAIAALTTLASIPARAGVVETDSYTAAHDGNNALTGFALAPTASNLFDSSSLSVTGFNSFAGSSVGVLQNTSVVWGYTFNGIASASAVSAYSGQPTWTLTVQLPTSASGYDLSQINVMSSWDNSLLNNYQKYDVAYATSPTSGYTSLASVDYESAPSQPQALETSLTGTLPTDVTSLQLTFYANGSGFAPALRKIEILGTAAVPEPSTYAMLALGMGVLFLGLRQRKLAKV